MKEVKTSDAPEAIGPYSQGIEYNGLVFCSGQIPLDPVSKKIVSPDVAEQTKQVMKNLTAVLQAAGSSLQKVIKCSIFLKNLDNFQIVNEIYGAHFSKPYPARATVQVAKLPMDVEVEIDAIAYK